MPSSRTSSRALVVGQDPEVVAALHLHLEPAGWLLFCLPTPELLEGVLRLVAPHEILLVLPAQPDASWGGALTTAASAARVGIRVIVVAPAREVVEPLAAVAGAERALSRAEVLQRPLSVVERAPGASAQPAHPPLAPPAVARHLPTAPPAGPALAGELDDPLAVPVPAARAPPFGAPPPLVSQPPATPRAPGARAGVDLLALIDEELVEEKRGRPQPARVEVNVSLVSDHNFYVGPTRRIDSGGVFISTQMPPPAGTRLQVRLGLADGRKLDVDGEVMFLREKSAVSGRQPAGCGVRLLGLPGWAVDAIDRFLLARPPIVYVPR